MHEVTVRQAAGTRDEASEDRLIALLAAGLERLLAKTKGSGDVDFSADESVTTTCPAAGDEEPTE